MIIKSLEVANFRKFRDPLRIEGFTDGLNIVVEPNETGKSTLLEALRAAFFIRYSAKTELVRSYVPIGDDVAPRVSVGFHVRGEPWTLEKQFMKSPSVRLAGSSGRKESDAAEETLQELLGFERGNNRGSDLETRGPLGMLWVEQATALAVESPNRIVRDTVRGVLESEVGAVTGGRRFDAIRSNVEVAYSALRTPTTGKSRGDLASAEVRVAAATEARQAAEANFREYESTLGELETAKSRLKILERDLVDPEVSAQRKKLEADLNTAETAALRSSAAEAQLGRADEVVKSAALRIDRLDGAEQRVATAESLVEEAQSKREEVQSKLDTTSNEEKSQRQALEAAREVSGKADAELHAARERSRVFATAAGARRSIEARKALAGLEERERELEGESARGIGGDDLDLVAKLELAAIQARARFEAGVVKVEVELSEGASLRIDGEAADAGSVDVFKATRFEMGDAGGIIVRPPEGASLTIEADLAAAEGERDAVLKRLGIKSHSDGIALNERAAAAARELIALRKQIAAMCPGDPSIALAPGADALRAYVASLGEVLTDVRVPTDDIDALQTAVTDAKLREASVSGRREDAREALSKAERDKAKADADLAGAIRESDAASENLQNVLIAGGRDDLEAALQKAQRDRAAKLDASESAREGSSAFDADAIRRRLENIDRATKRAGEERLELTAAIATLESAILREGTVGPAGRVAETRDEEEAAIFACERLKQEADTLDMLRKALAHAAEEASRRFLAPVTARAGRYIQRLLPGCDLSFSDELELAGVSRAGIDEACGGLSRGTQEQLAILTRLAFADLLLEDGAPISLILDDPLVYSDDARLETMTDILQDAAKRMQVILLTCRSKAFRHVDANRIFLK
ncbi:AAA family ATPase [Novosphingobium sp. BW1]|uniref:AAA family ATPase n=1 Tax=Novosphingobium sp. BW1 TaxID=2592621 RepID=UPI0011DEDA3D|nr:AAA family ATPase [Novosphingobium sp. BW1]TYC83801.1 AAA family ATPase [Novosphingobium sp. BW1]